MFEIIALLVVGSAIAGYARGRGGSPVLWGALAVGGYIAISLGSRVLRQALPGAQDPLWGIVAAWGWVGFVALYARFGLGAGKPGAGLMWTCPNCRYLNGRHAIICEACKEPYSKARQS